MHKSSSVDMTVGKSAPILLRFCLPMLISAIFQQLYNIADSFVVGQFVSDDPALSEIALSAVGVAGVIGFVYMAVAFGANIGCSVLISKFFGGKDFKNMKTAASTSIIAILSAALILTVFGLTHCDIILKLIGTPETILPDADTYLFIYTSALPFMFLYNICTGISTALGNSKTPLYFLVGSSLLNIALDLLFVIAFKMGVAGVAWATLIAQGISALLIFLLITKRLSGFASEKAKLFDIKMLKPLSFLAIPSIMQQSFVAVGNVLVQNVINGFNNESIIAGFSAGMKINVFAVSAFLTVSGAISAFTAQNLGANKPERIKEGFSAGVKMLLLMMAPLIIVFLIFAPNLAEIFLKGESVEAISAGTQFIRVIAPFYLIIGIKITTDGVLRGAGAMKYFAAGTLVDLILRVSLSYALAPIFGTLAVPIAWAVGWVMAGVMSIVFYRRKVWEKKAL